jgi:GTP cyclohydrolase I
MFNNSEIGASSESTEEITRPSRKHEMSIKHLLLDLNEKYADSVNEEVLENTPKRYMKAFEEMTKGYQINIKELIESALFDCEKETDDLVIIDNIAFSSLCEHHLLPFSGKCSIGYIPNHKLLGLSKFARLVEAFSQRLSLQERLTSQIAESLNTYLCPKGVAIYIESTHTCMCARGIKSRQSITKSVYTLGRLREDSNKLREFMMLIK